MVICIRSAKPSYLLGAKNGKKLRYDGLKGCTDYKKAVQIIKDGGYATSLTYVERICSIIEKWNLTQIDVQELNNESLFSLQVLGEILMLAGFFTFPEKKLDKLTIYSYNKANFR